MKVLVLVPVASVNNAIIALALAFIVLANTVARVASVNSAIIAFAFIALGLSMSANIVVVDLIFIWRSAATILPRRWPRGRRGWRPEWGGPMKPCR